MPIYLMHRSAWLRIKEVYTIQYARRTSKRRRKGKSPPPTPYGMVAECVEPPRIDSGMLKAEFKVSASKVTRFIARMYKVLDPDVVLIIKPKDEYHYLVEVYAPSREKLERALKKAKTVAAELRVKRSAGIAEAGSA